MKTFLPVLGLSLLAAAVFGIDRSTPQPEVPSSVVDEEPAATQVDNSDDSTEAKLARAVKGCIIANENYVKLKAENEELKAQLDERKRAANYWYSKSKSGQAKPAVQLDYSFGGNCANGQCGRSGRRGRR